EFFDAYALHFNEALAGRADLDAIAAQYTDSFVGAGPAGVSTADNDEGFREVLARGFEAYRAIGTHAMAMRDLVVTPIDDLHTMAKVFYRASYTRPSDSAPIEIDFDVTYVLHRSDRWQVFAFIAGDEQAL